MKRVCINRMSPPRSWRCFVGGAIAVVDAGSGRREERHGGLGNVTLTSKNVEALIASFPDVKKAGNALREEVQAQHQLGKDDVDASLRLARDLRCPGRLNGVVTPYGFTDFRQWLDVLVATARAYAFAKDGGDVDAKMAAAIEQIKNNPDIRTRRKAAARRDQGRRRRGRHPEAARGEHRRGDSLLKKLKKVLKN